MNIFLKIVFWLLISVFYLILSNVIGAYFDWVIWQEIVFFGGLIILTLVVQWAWRRWRVKRRFKSLEVLDTFSFDVKKAFKQGLKQLEVDQQLARRDFKNKPWYIGVAFSEVKEFDGNFGVYLPNNNANFKIRIVVLDDMFVLQFEFTSRLILERELQLYQQYLSALEKSFSKKVLGFLYFINALEFELFDSSQSLEFSEHFQKVVSKTLLSTEKYYPITIIFHHINQLPEYPAFLARVSRKVRAELLGWQARSADFYHSDDWQETKKQINDELLFRLEYAFANNIRLTQVGDYQLLTHLNRQLDALQIVFNAVSETVRFSLAGIYWVDSLAQLHVAKARPFTSKLFQQQLPAGIFQPKLTLLAGAAAEAKRHTLLAIYLAFMACAALYIAVAYRNVKIVIANELNQLPKHVYFHHLLTPDLHSAGVYQSIIRRLDGLNDKWLASMPYHAGIARLHDYYVRAYLYTFQKYILSAVNANLTTAMHSEMMKKDPVFRAELIFHVMNRLDLLNAKLHKQPLNDLSGPPLWNETLAAFEHQSVDFASLYVSYIELNQNMHSMQQEHDYLQRLAAQFNFSQDNFYWLPDYLNTKSNINSITLKSIWGGSNDFRLANDAVLPAYTYDGSQAISSFWQNFNEAFAPLGDFTTNRLSFIQWYQSQRYKNWSAFLLNFSNGYQTLNNTGEWDTVYINMSTERGVCYVLFHTIEQQFTDAISNSTELVNTPPAWLTLSKKLSVILEDSVKNGQVGSSKLNGIKQRYFNFRALMNYAKQKSPNLNSTQQLSVLYYESFDGKAAAANDFYKYTQLINKLFQPVVLPEQAFANSSSIYGGTNAAFNAVLNAEQLMIYRFNALGLEDNIFWTLYQIPLEYYVRYMNFVSNVYINQAWQINVLGKLQNTPEIFLNDLMFSETGVFWAFFNKYLNNYFTVQNSIVVPKFYFDVPYPFVDEFYDLVVDATSRYSLAKQQALFKKHFSADAPAAASGLPPVSEANAAAAASTPTAETASVTDDATLIALPPTLNAGALIQPQQITLLAECTKGNFELTNYNFPIEKALPVPLTSCLKASVRIYFADFYLEKIYAAPSGLLDFLKGINNNAITYTAADFPASSYYLQQYGITHIKLNYQFTGLADTLQQYTDYLKLQKTLGKEQRNYTSLAELPRIIAYTDVNERPALRAMIGSSNNVVRVKSTTRKPSATSVKKV